MRHQRNQTINQTKEHQHFTACIPDLRQHTVFVWLHLCISLFTPYVCVVGEVTWGNQGNNEPPPKTNHGARLNPHSSFPFHPAALVPLQEQGLEDAPPWINKTESHYVDDFWGNVQVWLMWKPICMLHPKATQWIWMTTLIYGNCNCFISLCKSIGSEIRVVIDN